MPAVLEKNVLFSTVAARLLRSPPPMMFARLLAKTLVVAVSAPELETPPPLDAELLAMVLFNKVNPPSLETPPP